MTQEVCRGWLGSDLVSWLAAVGATVLEPGIHLHWTAEGSPQAVLTSQGDNPVELLAAAWPDSETLDALPIAGDWNGHDHIPYKVHPDSFQSRTRSSRGHAHAWALSSTMTDLCVQWVTEASKSDVMVGNAKFNPGVEKGATLHERLEKVHGLVVHPEASIRASLSGRIPLVQANGLGFNPTRMESFADDSRKMVDPVAEVLAFFGLALFPARGGGRDCRLGASRHQVKVSQRMWLPLGEGEEFHWPAWEQPLDRHGIDALLDAWAASLKWDLLGVHAAWTTTQYRRRGREITSAFGSRRFQKWNRRS